MVNVRVHTSKIDLRREMGSQKFFPRGKMKAMLSGTKHERIKWPEEVERADLFTSSFYNLSDSLLS